MAEGQTDVGSRTVLAGALGAGIAATLGKVNSAEAAPSPEKRAPRRLTILRV